MKSSTQKVFDLANKEIGDKPGWLIWQLNNLWHRKVGLIFDKHGLSNFQYFTLKTIDSLTQKGLEPTQTDIAKFTGAHKMVVSSSLKELEKKGHIVKYAHKTNARFKLIKLSDIQWFHNLKAIVEPEVANLSQNFFDNSTLSNQELITVFTDLLNNNS